MKCTIPFPALAGMHMVSVFIWDQKFDLNFNNQADQDIQVQVLQKWVILLSPLSNISTYLGT